MRISGIRAENIPPIDYFQVDSLSDLVVLAGPNGVGKTRLVEQLLAHLQAPTPDKGVALTLDSTCKEERETWGQARLTTQLPADAAKLTAGLQRSRRRSNWRSSVLNFESDRSIQQVKPYKFDWVMTNPYEEEIAWSTTFGGIKDRFQDTVNSMFRLIENQKRRIANRAVQLRKKGKDTMKLRFADPMNPFKETFSQLVGPKSLVDPNPQHQNLEYELDGQVLPFNSLSSGEREVVNIAFDFLLRGPQDCIVFFDEPDLHLHPELSYKLIRTLQRIGSNNQFFLCTHSPDIISSALEQSVIIMAPTKKNAGSSTPENQAHVISETDETNQALRLLGHSIGVISLGKKLVLIEGTQSSLDKQTYGAITGDRYPTLVLVPSEGKDLIRSFEMVADRVLAQTLWGVEFFMLCDGDSNPQDPKKKDVQDVAKRKLRVLDRYHLENYFLDEKVWEQVFRGLDSEDSWLCSHAKIRQKLNEIARGVVSHSVALGISAGVRQKVGNLSIIPKHCHRKRLDELCALVTKRVELETHRVQEALKIEVISKDISARFQHIEKSLEQDSEDWKKYLPGRPILHQFLQSAKLDMGRGKRLYIKAARASSQNPFEEIEKIFEEFDAF